MLAGARSLGVESSKIGLTYSISSDLLFSWALCVFFPMFLLIMVLKHNWVNCTHKNKKTKTKKLALVRKANFWTEFNNVLKIFTQTLTDQALKRLYLKYVMSLELSDLCCPYWLWHTHVDWLTMSIKLWTCWQIVCVHHIVYLLTVHVDHIVYLLMCTCWLTVHDVYQLTDCPCLMMAVLAAGPGGEEQTVCLLETPDCRHCGLSGALCLWHVWEVKHPLTCVRGTVVLLTCVKRYSSHIVICVWEVRQSRYRLRGMILLLTCDR